MIKERIPLSKIAFMLDAIADSLESKGFVKEAFNIDKITEEVTSRVFPRYLTLVASPSGSYRILPGREDSGLGSESVYQYEEGIAEPRKGDGSLVYPGDPGPFARYKVVSGELADPRSQMYRPYLSFSKDVIARHRR